MFQSPQFTAAEINRDIRDAIQFQICVFTLRSESVKIFFDFDRPFAVFEPTAHGIERIFRRLGTEGFALDRIRTPPVRRTLHVSD